jgi:hypothetical protein
MKTILNLASLLAITLTASGADEPVPPVAKTYFIDVHEFGPGHADAAEISAAHQRDLAVEAQFGVHFIEYWIDADHGRVYCLSEARDADSVTAAHRAAHGLVPDRILTVTPGEASKIVGGQPLFLDIHELGAGNVDAAAVADAHAKDLEVEAQFGVNFINYWVDAQNGTVLCLSEAASADHVVDTHRHAHGLIPASVARVTRGS